MNDYISKTGHLSKLDLIKESAKKNIPAPKGDRAFDQILSEQIGESQSRNTAKQASTLSEIQSPLNLAFKETSFDAQKYAGKLADSIDLLETYAAFLDDPHKTLKQASGLLDKLLDQLQGLEKQLKATDARDPELNGLLTQIFTTASLEKIKMDRGDYLS